MAGGAFTISASCAGCGAECNRLSQRFGCRQCFEQKKDDGRIYCEQCALNHPDHKPPAFEPPTVTPIGNMHDLLAFVCPPKDS